VDLIAVYAQDIIPKALQNVLAVMEMILKLNIHLVPLLQVALRKRIWRFVLNVMISLALNLKKRQAKPILL